MSTGSSDFLSGKKWEMILFSSSQAFTPAFTQPFAAPLFDNPGGDAR
jgi:hypothetical protein